MATDVSRSDLDRAADILAAYIAGGMDGAVPLFVRLEAALEKAAALEGAAAAAVARARARSAAPVMRRAIPADRQTLGNQQIGRGGALGGA